MQKERVSSAIQQRSCAGDETKGTFGRGKVVLVSMPFCSLTSPSLALGLLQANLKRCGFYCITKYFSQEFAAILGKDLYQRISLGFPQTTTLLGEWIFSRANRPHNAGLEEQYLSFLEGCFARGDFRAESTVDIPKTLLAVRSAVPQFISACASDILVSRPQVVGVTSTFQQHQSSIALARELKQQSPKTAVILGGANCEGDMGLQTAQSFRFIDAVVSGEGDEVFPLMVESVSRGDGIPRLDGIFARNGSGDLDVPDRLFTSTVRDLDALPEPDFTDYFRYIAASGLVLNSEVRVPIETARGCWWGEKQHCTFCGLNGQSMRFRSKSAPMAIRAFVLAAKTYPAAQLSAVDNILDYSYFDDVMPALIDARREGLKLDIFYEVKANISFSKLRKLEQAGIATLQPGIESLSSNVLRIMKKGIKSIHNIQFLKNCRELGIVPHWSIIFGFPGEDPSDYAEMTDLIPAIRHLFPPGGFSRIRLDRFSPNFNQAAQLGIVNVRPFESYRYIYDQSDEDISRLAYFFEYDYADGRDPSAYTQQLARAVDFWREQYPAAGVMFAVQDGTSFVCDSRETETRVYQLSSIEVAALDFCHQAQPIDKVRAFLMDSAGQGLEVVENVKAARFLLERDGYFMSLVLPPGHTQQNTARTGLE